MLEAIKDLEITTTLSIHSELQCRGLGQWSSTFRDTLEYKLESIEWLITWLLQELMA